MLRLKLPLPGAIAVFSCHKHKETRLREFRLPRDSYAGWKVFYFLGDPRGPIRVEGNVVTLNCEDSYLHLAKKVALGLQFILDNYTVREGILRCGDDLVFDERALVRFVECRNKPDYLGVPGHGDGAAMDHFMPAYYSTHPEDFADPLHGLTVSLDDIGRFKNTSPALTYAGGVLVYLSVKSCEFIVSHFASIGWDPLTRHSTCGNVYCVEDFAVGFILNLHGVPLTAYRLYADLSAQGAGSTVVARHTNKYK